MTIKEYIIEELQKYDTLDYIGALAPVLLSVVTIVFTIYATLILPKKRKFSATLYWDDMMSRFVVIIINQGNAVIVIDSIRLFIKEKGEERELGKRKCVYDNKGKAIIIKPGEGYSFIPRRGNIRDLFGYKGHFFEATNENKDKQVFIEAIDIKGKKYREKTDFTLGEIDENILYQNEDDLD